MDIESLLRLLVPLGFLAIWAISWLFNRESQSLPPRSSTGAGSGAGRPGSSTPQSFGLEPAGTGRPSSSEPLRWSNQTMSPGERRGQGRADQRGNDDDILIISETRPARGGSGGQFGSRTRRGRPRTEPKDKPQAPTVPTTSLGHISQQIAREIARPIDLSPLNPPSIPISNDLTHVSPVTGQAAAVDMAQVTRAAVLISARDPKRLREAFLLAEILKPPPSARVFRQPHPSSPPPSEIDSTN